jgi:hypothetical protein
MRAVTRPAFGQVPATPAATPRLSKINVLNASQWSPSGLPIAKPSTRLPGPNGSGNCGTCCRRTGSPRTPGKQKARPARWRRCACRKSATASQTRLPPGSVHVEDNPLPRGGEINDLDQSMWMWNQLPHAPAAPEFASAFESAGRNCPTRCENVNSRLARAFAAHARPAAATWIRPVASSRMNDATD